MHSFEELYQLFSSRLEEEIVLLKAREPKNLYEPVIYTLNMGGKRLRPILLLMACELFGSETEEAFPAAFAIEMFHNFTLLHDDIMDGAVLRRNNETIHIKYSSNTAILSGDAMSILSYEYINKCKSPNYRQVFDQFTNTALKICEGQQFDMDYETRDDVSVSEYLNMIGLKTAVLIASSLKIGALIAMAPSEDAHALFEFGFNLGMAFQLQDDYLDTFGDTNSFGKNIGGDIVANKKTFMMLKALELAKGETLRELRRFISSVNFNREEKIKDVRRIYMDLGVVELTRKKMEEYYQQSIQFLDQIKIDSLKKNQLLNIAKKVMKRQS